MGDLRFLKAMILALRLPEEGTKKFLDEVQRLTPEEQAWFRKELDHQVACVTPESALEPKEE